MTAWHTERVNLSQVSSVGNMANVPVKQDENR